MANLTGRVGRLERVAEAAGLRELRREADRIAREKGVDPERLWELYREVRAERARLRATGGGPVEYFAYLVGRIGKTEEQLAADGITLKAIEREW